MATTTTNFGFDIPQSSDYVKNGATAIAELGQDIDTRFGNVATYRNQLVNVVSGVSRPIAYSTQVGSNSITGSGTVTFTAGRFTQSPIVLATASSTNNTRTSVTVAITSTTSVTFYVWSGTTASTSAAAIGWQAIQQTSAATAG